MAKATRQAFGEALAKYGKENPEVVVLDADLAKSTMTKLFAQACPDRFFEMGIQEANMIGVAAGLALCGKKPFCASFACFLTGRYDTIRMSIAYSEAPVRLVGTHAGIGIGDDGNSQMGLEDIGLMRALPNMIVLQPADERETAQMVAYLCNGCNQPAYLRLTRQKLPDVYDDQYRWQLGKGVVLRDGTELTLVASGGTVGEALAAAGLLQERGVSARVVNIHTIKPLDVELLVRCAEETGCIFTVEDHYIDTGMGSAICEVLSEHRPTPVKRWGVTRFGQSGAPEEMYARYEIDRMGIAKHAQAFLERCKS